jgi:hypothetical protein
VENLWEVIKMGTRGVFGFHKNGVDKITYNHYDSYPSGLGEAVRKFVADHDIEELNKIFDRIILVNGSKPTPEQITECEQYTNLSVSERSTNDWYCLLHDAQGNPEVYAYGLKYMEDSASFLKNSLFCEWGYVINLATNRLEIYVGFQKSPQDNRYRVDKHTDNTGNYYNCALIREIPLSQVKNFDMNAFETEVEEKEE